jgi:hypothetical protein
MYSLAFIKIFVHDDTRHRDILFLSESCIVCSAEDEFVALRIGDSSEGVVGCCVVGGEETNDHDFVGFTETLEVFGSDEGYSR